MKLDLQVPSFTGFYQGIWDQSENEWIETHEMKYGEHEDFESLNQLGSLPEYRTELAALIKKYHTSCDGFWSFMSNDIEEWFGLMYDPSNDHYTSYFTGYLLSLMAPEEIEGLNESEYEYVLESTDYHCVEPETDDAKDEWEVYLKYGSVYTDWAVEHPMRHPDPYRPGYNTIDDWEDYKEQFLDYVKEYEKEQKRKAVLAAQPEIPGLFD